MNAVIEWWKRTEGARGFLSILAALVFGAAFVILVFGSLFYSPKINRFDAAFNEATYGISFSTVRLGSQGSPAGVTLAVASQYEVPSGGSWILKTPRVFTLTSSKCISLQFQDTEASEVHAYTSYAHFNEIKIIMPQVIAQNAVICGVDGATVEVVAWSSRK